MFILLLGQSITIRDSAVGDKKLLTKIIIYHSRTLNMCLKYKKGN